MAKKTPMANEDVNNFRFTLDTNQGRPWDVEMLAGELTINNVSYEDNEEDPTYDLVRAFWVVKEKLKQ